MNTQNQQKDLTLEEYMALNDFPDFSQWDAPNIDENKHDSYTEQELTELRRIKNLSLEKWEKEYNELVNYYTEQELTELRRIKNLSPEEWEKEYNELVNYIYDVYGEDISLPNPDLEFSPAQRKGENI